LFNALAEKSVFAANASALTPVMPVSSGLAVRRASTAREKPYLFSRGTLTEFPASEGTQI
jgi:hypothetical protein